MTDEDQSNDPQDDAEDSAAPQDESTNQERALETWGESDLKRSVAAGKEGTLFAVQPHTGQHPMLDEENDPSVTDSLKKAKGMQATMYGPTAPGGAKVGSTHATQFGPTDAGRPPSSHTPTPAGGPGTMQSAGVSTGQHPVAPFGGKIVVGTRVGQIEVTGVLGKGGMGEVFRGYHQALDIEVALKVLPDELSRNELVRQRFLREARLCVKLDHTNIVRVYNVDEYAGNLFLTMELVEGTDAAHMLKNGGRFKYRRALEIGAASADALGYAHSQGLVHRDIKPHNILLGARDGKIKISDFGLARAATSASHLTMSGQIMGTPHYMSPEQAEAKEVTDKSDVYSLGVTLYHMLTGETPFVGDTPISVAVQHIAKEIMFPEARFAPFPKELVAVLKRMTAKDQSKRCSSRQAAVWLRKLIEMAPSEDIQVAPEAMQTMAPVVRESQAFEAAAKQRQEHDVRAREAAQTMLATVREQGPAETQPEPRPASQPQIQPARGGLGGKVAAAIIVLVLLGGGAAAAWHFGLLPVAPGANNGTQDSSDNRAGTPSNGRTDAPSNLPVNTPITPANNAVDPPPSNGRTPPRQDDRVFQGRLDAAQTAFAASGSLAELHVVGQTLEELSLQLGVASQAQRDLYHDLKKRYDDQFALHSAREGVEAVTAGLTSYRKLRGNDYPRALQALNGALEAGERMGKLSLSPGVEKLVGESRATALGELARETAALDKAISDESAEFEAQKKYDKADETLARLSGLKLDPQRLEQLKNKRWDLQVRALHAAIDSRLEVAKTEDKQYKEADKLVGELEVLGVPPHLKSAHEPAVRAVRDAVARRFGELLLQAAGAAEKGEFPQARGLLKRAGDDLPLNRDQYVIHGNEVFYLGVKEQIHLCRTKVDQGEFNEALAHAQEARKRIDDPGEREVPPELVKAGNEARAYFEAKREERFAELMKAAEAAMTEKAFDEAGRNIQAASEMPLTPKMSDTLEDFAAKNKQALAQYVEEQLGNVADALEKGNFDAASEAMGRVEALKAAGESGARLEELRTKFRQEAATRHAAQLAEGDNALDQKRYPAVRSALAAMKKIPVEDEARREEERKLGERYLNVLGSDVEARLKQAAGHMDANRFKEARSAIADTEKIAVEGDMRESVKVKNAELDARIQNTLAGLLREAEEARSVFDFDESSEKLAQARDMAEVLTSAQLEQILAAEVQSKKDFAAWVESLFKRLEGCVKEGNEAEGAKLVKRLEGLRESLSAGDRERLRRLFIALTGESETDRYNRMPAHLQKLAGDRYVKSEQHYALGDRVTALHASDDGRFGAAGTSTGKIVLFELKRGRKLGERHYGNSTITAIAINNSGTAAVAGNSDGRVVLLEIAGTDIRERSLEVVNAEVTRIVFSTDLTVAFVGTRRGEVHRFNTESRTRIGSTPTGVSRVLAMALSPDGNWLAVGGVDGQIAVFDAVQMILQAKLQVPVEEYVFGLGFSADSRQLLAGTEADGVSIWDTAQLKAQPRRSFKGLSEKVMAAGFTADGKRAVALDNEKRLMVWDAASGTEMRKLEHTALSPTGKSVVVMAAWISPDGTVLIGTRDGDMFHLTAKVAG